MTGEGATSPVGAQHRVGRYEVFGQIAKGGMASVHLGRVIGAGSFARAVAIKKLHEQYATDVEFRQMFLNEAELLARVRHPNVVPTLDLIEEEGALYIVMDFVEGVTLRDLLGLACRLEMRVPWKIVLSIMENALRGLHAAHEARDEQGEPLELVHRDVSPANILVGNDGSARVFDFGIAKAIGKVHTTQDGQVKGTVPYMTPEQLAGEPVTRRSDVFAATVVLWEALTNKRLFASADVGHTMHRLLTMDVPPPSALVGHLPKALDELVRRGIERDPTKRFATAADMADALRQIGPPAPLTEVAEWVKDLAEERFDELAELVRNMERTALLSGDAPGGSVRFSSMQGAGGAGGSTERSGSTRTPLSLSVDASVTDGAVRVRRRRLGWLAAGTTAGLVVAALLWSRASGPTEDTAAGSTPTGTPAAASLEVAPSASDTSDRDSAPAATASGDPTATATASATSAPDAGGTVPQARPTYRPPPTPPKPKPGSSLYSIE